MNDIYYELIETGTGFERSYTKVLKKLDDIVYRSNTVPSIKQFNNNRIANVYEFRNDYNIYRSTAPTVLEILVVLAIRIDDEFLYTNERGNNPADWFWVMLECMGLTQYSDEVFDASDVELIIYNFMDNNYLPDGTGSVGHVPAHLDARDMDLWSISTNYVTLLTM